MTTYTKYVGGPPIEVPIEIPVQLRSSVDRTPRRINCCEIIEMPNDGLLSTFLIEFEEVVASIPDELKSSASIEIRTNQLDCNGGIEITWSRPETEEETQNRIEIAERNEAFRIAEEKEEMRRQYERYKTLYGDE